MIPTQHTADTPFLVGPVHFYSAEINGDLVMFDTGAPTEATKSYIQQHIDLAKLKYVFLTHCHIDHYGLAAWLEEVSDATIYLSARDHLRLINHDGHLQGVFDLMETAGFDERFMISFRECMTDVDAVYPTYPKRYKLIEQGLPEHLGLSALHCPGHSQGDMALCGKDWAVTGDMMLKRIFQTPILETDLRTGQRFNNYQAYCNSLSNIIQLKDKTILPGHRENIDGVEDSIIFYISKLVDRSIRLKDLPKTLTPCEIVERQFGLDLDYPFASYAKVAEIIFFQDFLNDPDRLIQAIKGIGLYSAMEDKLDLVMA